MVRFSTTAMAVGCQRLVTKAQHPSLAPTCHPGVNSQRLLSMFNVPPRLAATTSHRVVHRREGKVEFHQQSQSWSRDRPRRTSRQGGVSEGNLAKRVGGSSHLGRPAPAMCRSLDRHFPTQKHQLTIRTERPGAGISKEAAHSAPRMSVGLGRFRRRTVSGKLDHLGSPEPQVSGRLSLWSSLSSPNGQVRGTPRDQQPGHSPR